VEHPTLFRQALGLLPDRAGFCARLGLTEVMLEQFLRSGPAIP